jgi:hypothetical protein
MCPRDPFDNCEPQATAL